MKLTVEGLEKERDFYFGKLRDVEVLCQEHELTGGPVVRKVRHPPPPPSSPSTLAEGRGGDLPGARAHRGTGSMQGETHPPSAK